MKVVNQEVVNAAQNFKLVGISWSNDPDAMIEDTAAKKTFLSREGRWWENLRCRRYPETK